MTLSRTLLLRSLAFALLLGIFALARADALQDVGRLMKQGQNAQALEQVDKFLAGKPRDAQGRFLKGLILTELNRGSEALAVFQKLTEDYPDLPEPYNNMAVIYAQQKQYDKAKQALEAAIRTHPAYATAHENLGDVYARMATQAYDKALQFDSSNAGAQTKLAMIRELVGTRPTPLAKPAQAAPAVEPKPVAVATEAKPAEPVAMAVEAPKPVVVKPVVAKPVEPQPAPVAGNTTTEVTEAVQAWASAWSKKDVKAYLGHYASDFRVPGGLSRARWETERTQRITKPGAIQVTVGDLRVSPEGNGQATVRFRQTYQSANLKTSSGKALVLVRRDGRWLIQQERVGK